MRIPILVLTILLLPGPDLSATVPISRPDTDISYSCLRELYLRGYISPSISLFMPTDYQEMSTQAFEELPESLIKLTSPLSSLNKRFSVDNQTADFHLSVIPHGYLNDDDKKGCFALIPEMRCRLTSSLTVGIAYRADGALVDDSLYTGKKWESFAGYAELAVLGYRGKRFAIDIGRRKSVWGIARKGQTLMHSSMAMPMDGLFFDYRLNQAVSFHSTIACLSAISDLPPFNEGEYTENRYFSAHALRISPFAWWDVVLKESVVYGGIGRRFEPVYTIPFVWFHAEQLNSNTDDNTFFGLETVFRWNNKFAGYLEVLIDDFQIEKKYATDDEPNEIGWIAGVDIFDFPLLSSALELEYTRIANYTYNQIKPRNVYINQGYPIGHPIGPDHESLRLSYSYHFSENLTAELSLYLLNRGEGRLGDVWENPWAEIQDYKEKFPSGTVEKTRGGSIDILFHKNEFFQSKLLIKAADISNSENIPGTDKTSWEIYLEIIYNLPKLTWRFGDD